MSPDPEPRGHNKFGVICPLGGTIISKNVFWLISHDLFGLATTFQCVPMLLVVPMTGNGGSKVFQPVQPMKFHGEFAKQEESSYLGRGLTYLNQSLSHDS